jgi:hypothetical protein
MEQLNTYVQQARQQGQSDEQIRQSLLTSGWNAEQVNAALLGTAATPAPVGQPANYRNSASAVPTANVGQPFTVDSQQPVQPKRTSKLPILVVGVIVLLLIVGGGGFALLGQKTSYQTVIQQFVTAIQKKDKATADSLESPAMKTFGQKNVGTASFYDACQQASQLCTPLFTTAFLDKATKSYKDYTASNGAKGKEIVYTLKQSLSGSQAGGQGCSSASTNTLTVAAVPKGNTWQIDNADPSINASANLCLAPGGTSSVGN